MTKTKRISIISVVLALLLFMLPVSGNTLKANAATNIQAQALVDYLKGLVGTSYKSNRCLVFVNETFMHFGNASSTACCAWKYGNTYCTHTTRDDIPVGADVFFGSTGCRYNVVDSNGHDCGHIAIYIGGGRIVHAYDGKIQNTTIKAVEGDGYTYRGWGFHKDVNIVSESYLNFSSDCTKPTGKLAQGKPFTIKGTITSSPELNRVWGGVYKRNGEKTDQYCDVNPKSTSYDLAKYFDYHIIFDELPVGYYTYKIEASTTDGQHKQIESQFQIGDPVSDLQFISLTGKPTKTAYYVGDELDVSGVKVTASYSDNSTKDVTNSVKFSSDLSKAGTQKVTISYTENSITKSVSYDITVSEVPTPVFSGKGTKEEPYLISSKADLEQMRDLVNNTDLNHTYGHAYYKQTADIDLENESWTPIGLGYDGDDGLGDYNCTTRMFFGSYDGGEHYIKGLNVNGNWTASGLFAYIRENGTVSNLVVYGTITNKVQHAGGIAGAVQYGAVISNCGFIGDVTGETKTGGIAGEIWAGGNILNCYHIGNVSSANLCGGITARIAFSEYGKDGDSAAIKNCYQAGGTISGNSIGAITAECVYYEGTSNTATISNCYASSDCGANVGAKNATSDTSLILRASEMKKLAEDLGNAFADSTDNSLNSGYPVFTWEIPETPETVKGDVNDDGSVNLKDVVMIRRYIAGGWNVELDETVADVNGDGLVNLKDVVMIRRYIAGGWNITL